MKAQAAKSLDLEDECHRFDVCVARDDISRIFLYELYSDEAAFRTHLGTDHYAAFDQAVSGMVLSKEVRSYHLFPSYANRTNT